MRGRSYDVTTRPVEDTRSWMVVGLYVLVVPLSVLLMAWGYSEGGSGGLAGGLLFGLFALLIGSFFALGAIFRDATYLREVKARWRPKWWNFVGVPVGVGIVGAATTGVVGFEGSGAPVGLMLFAAASWVASVVYIRRRHNSIGVP